MALACALAQAAEVLVADEPTSALDPETGAAILALVQARRQSRGLALVLVTHDLVAARTCCDRILVLDAGQVIEDGPAADVLSPPRSTAARDLRAAMRAIDRMTPCSARAA